DNQERLLQMAKESKARQEQFLGLRGQATANSRLRAAYDDAGYANEQITGISNLFFTRDLITRIENDPVSVLATLEDIRNLLVNRTRLLVNITADNDNWQNMQGQLKTFIETLPATDSAPQTWQRDNYPQYEGFAVPTQVNFVGKGANLYDLGYEASGSHVAIFKYLNFGYLWNRVRVQGGAYGGRAIFNHLSGVLTYLSWQDPNLVDTLKVYDEAAQYLQAVNLDKDDLEKAIIGAIGDMDNHMLSDAKGYQSMVRYLTGYTDEIRQTVRDEVFATSNDDFHKLGDALAKVAAEGRIVVTSWKEKLEDTNQNSDVTFDIKDVL
ncbi:MAG: peptidase M16, partial [Aggregatilineales bacterium]